MEKGFTLIELLVVIAIIGILASVVLITFPGATKKAKDARVISAITQARTVAAFIYSEDGNYDNFTCTSSQMVNLCKDINNNADSSTTIEYAPSPNSTTTCIYAKLKGGKGGKMWYCADSNGIAGYCTTDPSGDGKSGVCPDDCSD